MHILKGDDVETRTYADGKKASVRFSPCGCGNMEFTVQNVPVFVQHTSEEHNEPGLSALVVAVDLEDTESGYFKEVEKMLRSGILREQFGRKDAKEAVFQTYKQSRLPRRRVDHRGRHYVDKADRSVEVPFDIEGKTVTVTMGPNPFESGLLASIEDEVFDTFPDELEAQVRGWLNQEPGFAGASETIVCKTYSQARTSFIERVAMGLSKENAQKLRDLEPDQGVETARSIERALFGLEPIFSENPIINLLGALLGGPVEMGADGPNFGPLSSSKAERAGL